jgi:hypothetical protein
MRTAKKKEKSLVALRMTTGWVAECRETGENLSIA